MAAAASVRLAGDVEGVALVAAEDVKPPLEKGVRVRGRSRVGDIAVFVRIARMRVADARRHLDVEHVSDAVPRMVIWHRADDAARV